MKLTLTIPLTFEIDVTVQARMDYVRRTGDYDMENATIADWDFNFHSITQAGEGKELDVDFSPETLETILQAYKDSYDPTP